MEIITIDQDSGIPLIGLAYLGILTKNLKFNVEDFPTILPRIISKIQEQCLLKFLMGIMVKNFI